MTTPQTDLSRVALLERAGEWQPIESAPKDGTDMLISNFNNMPAFKAVGWWSNLNKMFKYTGGDLVHQNNLTHWMPLPAAPPTEPAPHSAKDAKDTQPTAAAT